LEVGEVISNPGVTASSSICRDFEKSYRLLEDKIKCLPDEKLDYQLSVAEYLFLIAVSGMFQKLFVWSDEALLDPEESQYYLARGIPWYKEARELIGPGEGAEFFRELSETFSILSMGMRISLDDLDDLIKACSCISESIWSYYIREYELVEN
jgi:hypothetical protein